ncbi:hypothetical protein GQ457_08G021080 [Hibiscus cannabinus]
MCWLKFLVVVDYAMVVVIAVICEWHVEGMRNDAMGSWHITSLVEARRQEDQGLNHLFKYIFVAMIVYVSNGEGMPCFGAC